MSLRGLLNIVITQHTTSRPNNVLCLRGLLNIVITQQI